ncbi:hypothetical protein VNI00_007950 [Paramarasmius palmivorus]|uniref:Peptidase A1 domain-containing protein n=1 Tax=Paramarasmius palmivorus TaxID=297713 RepID=A0AAW0CZ47_9AGAR
MRILHHLLDFHIFSFFLIVFAQHGPFTVPLNHVSNFAPHHRRSEPSIETYRKHVEHARRRLERRFNRIGVPLAENVKLDGLKVAGGDKQKKPMLDVLFGQEEYHSTRLEIESLDIGYYAAIQLGTPFKTFNVLVDSGSADLWVAGDDCRSYSGGNCGPHNTLGTNSSTTFQGSDEIFMITYGSGAVLGTMANDTIQLAGLTLDEYRFGVTSLESDSITSTHVPWDGILGFGKQSIMREPHTKPLLSAFCDAGLITSPTVSFKIPRLQDQGDPNTEGEMTIGAVNPSRFVGDSIVKMKNTNPMGFWEVPVDSITVNGQGMMKGEGKKAILDTGTLINHVVTYHRAPKGELTATHYRVLVHLWILIPERSNRQDAERIHSSIPGATSDGEQWKVDCNAIINITFSFAGRAFPIDPRDMIFKTSDGCFSGITQGNIGMGPNDWLVGDTFLKNVYLSLDMETDEISLAKLT